MCFRRGIWGFSEFIFIFFIFFVLPGDDAYSSDPLPCRRGMAAFMGRDVSKLKAKGGGKFKYMSEKEMVDIAAPFSPYR